MANNANNAINEYSAAELSLAAYLPVDVFENSIAGWQDVTGKISKELNKNFYDQLADNNQPINEFRVFVNTVAKQIVIAFKGSNNASNFISALKPADQGYSSYVAIEQLANDYLNQLINFDYKDKGYTILTDGHSLGGGMAQEFALANDLNGYGQNSLPIPAKLSVAYNQKAGNNGAVDAALAAYRNNVGGHIFDEVNVAGDIATGFYSKLLNEQYLNQAPRELNSSYGRLEKVGAFFIALPIPFPLLKAAGLAIDTDRKSTRLNSVTDV